MTSCESLKSSNADILSSKGWKVVLKNELGDIYQPDSCELDDCIYFHSNGSITAVSGPINCEWDESDGEMANWSLSKDGHTITIDGFTFSLDISEKKMVWSSILGGLTFEPC